MPKVSVLTTVFNREKYLEACIESVLQSTFQDWELIIVDDQSRDNSVEIAQSYAENDSRIHLHVNPINLGDYPNRNYAASLAKGKYIKFLDADDLIYPNGLEVMVKTMEEYPNAALGISQEVAEDVEPYPFQMSPYESFKREFLMRGVLRLGPTGTIFKRAVFEELGGFTGTRFIGDVEMWYKMALEHPVVKIAPNLIYWREHDDQEITKGQTSFFYLENSYKHAMQTLEQDSIPLNALEVEQAKLKLNKRFSRNLMRLYFKGQIKLARQIQNSCGYSWWHLIKHIK